MRLELSMISLTQNVPFMYIVNSVDSTLLKSCLEPTRQCQMPILDGAKALSKP